MTKTLRFLLPTTLLILIMSGAISPAVTFQGPVPQPSCVPGDVGCPR
ncbi:MAG: hypothetical protein JWQ87_2588 [Candidatus Sulfotelmatobacter sp.]|nr:hypothetical protein [Candidatus Sulfotelmatobacter sp.]